ncbi:MAG: succinate dehydrogenase cytochrome b subunit [Ignavibacteria bacterium]|nr:succinate dehydrogenase cytochrome b subunit [Ignavibacteria bacterium]
MGTFTELYHSSIGKKLVVGLTGILLCIYLVVHLGGNLFLFKDDGVAAFDAYAEILPSLLVIRIIEILLFAVFIGHIVTGTLVWIRNKRARPRQYEVTKPNENSSFFSRTMFVTGSIVFIFLIVHMRSFWFTSRFKTDEHFSMFATVKEAFTDPVYSAFYVLAMVLLGFHLRHGFQSAFQTFGLKTKKYTPLIEGVGILFWFVIPLCFAAMPIYFLLKY